MTPQFQCIVRSYTYSRTITPMLSPFYASSLTQIPSLRHGFFTRHGGVSEGYFASLNCKGRDDNPAHVHKNRRRITNFLGGRTWIGLDQKHTNNVLFIDKPLDHSPSADAMVTTTPGLVLGIITADCVPILLADKQKPIIGAVHSGWRGTFDGIIENTVALMREKGATDIIAAIGPCIHQESYEVGPEFREYFENHPTLPQFSVFNDFFKESKGRPGHFLFDLPKLVQHALKQQNISYIDMVHQNTFANEEHFFSYRRKTLRNEPDMGCQASCIVIRLALN